MTTAPNAVCIRHSLPQADQAAEPTIASLPINPTAISPPPKTRRSNRATEYNPYLSTRVETDARGRRTMVNDLR
jgi:hypothetical protein